VLVNDPGRRVAGHGSGSPTTALTRGTTPGPPVTSATPP